MRARCRWSIPRFPSGCVPPSLAILGIREELRRQRPAGRVLAVEVAPRPRQRVIATDFDAAAEPVVRLERPALIAALEIVRVLDQVDVEGALRVRDLAGRKVRPRDVEVVEVAEDPVDAHAAALSNQAADASGVLDRIRRIERAADERVHARQVGTSHTDDWRHRWH